MNKTLISGNAISFSSNLVLQKQNDSTLTDELNNPNYSRAQVSCCYASCERICESS